MNTAEKSVGLGLRALRQLSSSEFLDRLGVRSHLERALYSSTKNGFKSATVAGRAYKAATSLGKPARQPRAAGKGLFDLTPTDEQQMLVEAVQKLGARKLSQCAQAQAHALLSGVHRVWVLRLGRWRRLRRLWRRSVIGSFLPSGRCRPCWAGRRTRSGRCPRRQTRPRRWRCRSRVG